jgi:hypothetical protein
MTPHHSIGNDWGLLNLGTGVIDNDYYVWGNERVLGWGDDSKLASEVREP